MACLCVCVCVCVCVERHLQKKINCLPYAVVEYHQAFLDLLKNVGTNDEREITYICVLPNEFCDLKCDLNCDLKCVIQILVIKREVSTTDSFDRMLIGVILIDHFLTSMHSLLTQSVLAANFCEIANTWMDSQFPKIESEFEILIALTYKHILLLSFYLQVGDVSYHDYCGILINPEEKASIIEDLGPKNMVSRQRKITNMNPFVNTTVESINSL